MAESFATTYGDVLDYINRPSAKMLTQAKREINNALLWIQRKRAFKMTERLIKVEIPANTLFVSLDTACEGVVRTMLNCQKLVNASANEGTVIDIVDYQQIVFERGEYQKRYQRYDVDPTLDEPSHGDFVGDTHKGVMFLIGENNVGFYPVQQTPVHLLINLNIWLPKLSADADSNFFLTYCYDVILSRTLYQMNAYLKADQRYTFNKDRVVEDLEDVIAWDADIRQPEKAR